MTEHQPRSRLPRVRIVNCLEQMAHDGGWVLQADLQRCADISDGNAYRHFGQLIERGAIERVKVRGRCWLRLNIGPTPPAPDRDTAPAAGSQPGEPDRGDDSKPFVHRLVPAGTPADVPRGVVNSVFALGDRGAASITAKPSSVIVDLHRTAAAPPEKTPRLYASPSAPSIAGPAFRCGLWSDGSLQIVAPTGSLLLPPADTRALLHYLDKMAAEAA